MSKKQTTTATATSTTDATETAKKEEKTTNIVEFMGKLEKKNNDTVAFISLPRDAETVVKFSQIKTKIVRGVTPEQDTIETETIPHNVTVTGEKMNSIVNEKFGLSKEQLLNQIATVPQHQQILVGMANARVRGMIKRSLNPFAL